MSNISYPKYKLPSDLSVNTLTSSNGVVINNLGNGLNNQYLGVDSAGNIITTSSLGGTITIGGTNILTQPCHNSTGILIGAYKIVHITGNTSADVPRVTLADWSLEASSSNVLGITSASIGIGADGEAVVQGVITGVDLNYLSGLENGQILYLSSSGQITNIKPEAPKHMVTVGQVVSKATTGNNVTIYVSIQNGYELSELHNVSLDSSAGGDLLSYNSNVGLWKNGKFLSGSYSLTGSLAIGSESSTATEYSFANGLGCQTNSDFSHAEGQGTQTSGPASHAEGLGSETYGSYSHAEGYGSKTYGLYSHAEGDRSITNIGAFSSHAQGYACQTYGIFSHAEGYESKSYNTSSHAEGYKTTANAPFSHTEGVESQTNGSGSHAEGSGSEARGDYSHAEGRGTIAVANYQHVQGQYNATSSTAAMLVGNGSSTGDRKNILEVYNDRVVISGSLYATGQNYSRPNDLIALTQLTSSGGLVSHTIPTGTNFTVINLNSDGIPRLAKTTFIAPPSGMVSIQANFDMTIVNSAAVQMIGLHFSSLSTTTPSAGWYRINADDDASSGQFYAIFNLLNLIPGTSYTYYFMGVCDFTGNTIRASRYQSVAYTPAADLPGPFNIFVYDLGSVSILTNPSS